MNVNWGVIRINMLDRIKHEWNQWQPHSFTVILEWMRKGIREMGWCLVHLVIPLAETERKRLSLFYPFPLTDCLPQEAIDTMWKWHMESVLGPCQKKNVAKGTRSAVWGYLNLSYVSDHTRCSFSLRTARLSLRVDYRQLIVEVVQTKVSLCQSHFIFSFARKPFPSLFLTHTLRLDPYVY